MGWLDDFASAVGHTAQSLVDEVGSDIQGLESLIGDLASYGMDVFSVASKIGLSPVSFLKAVVSVMSGDPHAQLLRYSQVPGLWVGGSSSQMSGHWQTMVSHHSDIKQQIDTELTGVFQEGGSFNYSGPAADSLLTTHTHYQNYFTTLVDHAQTQQNRYSTLDGHAQTFLTDVHSTVYNLPSPVAAVGVVTLDTAADVDPAIQFMLSLIGLDLSGMAISLPIPVADVPLETILAIILIILLIILLLVALFVLVKDAVTSHTTVQNTTTVPTPTPAPTPTPKPRWPWPDPMPPWLPKNDDECIRHIAQVKAVFPAVRADLIAWLTCLQPPMTPQQVIDLFTVWTTHGMTQQDINNFLDRIRNLRVRGNQLSRDRIIAFITLHQQDIPGLWSQYTQVQNITGVDQIWRDLANGNPGDYRGAKFQLDWLVAHRNQVQEVEPPGPNGQKGPDFLLTNGTVVDAKSRKPGASAKLGAEIAAQIMRYRRLYPGQPIMYVFDSSGRGVPAPSVVNMLQATSVADITDGIARQYVVDTTGQDRRLVTPAQIAQAKQDILAAINSPGTVTWNTWP